jgi:nitroreductase
MDIAAADQLLTTTRSVRKRLDFDRPVDKATIADCLEIAVQAPTGGNIARYHFVILTDPEKIRAMAEIYKRAYYELWGPGTVAAKRAFRKKDKESFDYLAENIQEAPTLVVPCVERPRVMGGRSANGSELGSIFPAIWSLMLAFRARGIGSALTTIHANYEEEAAKLLGNPAEVRQAALLPVAYFKGDTFKPAYRVPAKERTYWNQWGNLTD